MTEYIYCTQCGAKNAATNNFCTACGQSLVSSSVHHDQETRQTQAPNASFIDNTTKQLNRWTGEDKSVSLNVASMFGGIFEHHTQQDAEEIFIAGTFKTTPSLAEVSDAPVRPWLFSRILMLFVVVIGLFLSALMFFQGEKTYPGLVFISSCAIPFSLLILFFEINVFKNISIYVTMKVFLLGGAFSLLTTLFLYSIVGASNFSIVEAILIGLVEETGKLIIVIYYVEHYNLSHIFNGMLIGAAVGAGFAAFENAGYAQDYGISVLLIRSIGSLGTHTLWCAILGAALVIVKRDHHFDSSMLVDPHFINFFIFVVTLHAVWDMNLPLTSVKVTGLIVMAWIAILVLINAGLREVGELQRGKVKVPKSEL